MDVDIKKYERFLERMRQIESGEADDLSLPEIRELRQDLHDLEELFYLAEKKLMDAVVRAHPPLDGLSHGDKDKG